MEFVGIDKLSLLDYEGYCSAVVFSRDCNFRCPFCHNGLTVINSKDSISFEEIISFLKTRVGLLDAVVFSGGEPTLVPNLKSYIKQVKDLGFKVKLDTNGSNPKVLKDLIESKLLDYIAMDIKNSEDMYALTAGCPRVDMSAIKESVNLIMSSNIGYEFRTTLVNEYHSVKSITEMAELVKGANKLFLQKFVNRDGVFHKYLTEVPKSTAEEYKKILNKFVKDVNLRGY